MSSNSGISFSGIGSGVDTNAIVSALMKLERQPITNLNTQKSKITTKSGVESGIQSLMNTLRDKAKVLADAAAFNANSVSVKDTAMLSATATSSAAAGTYAVTVSQLAKANTLEASAAPTLGDDTLTISAGGKSAVVTVNAGESLSALASRINTTADTPVAASVINNRMVLISKTEGSSGAISVTSTGTTAADFGFVERQPAQDAIATINGVSITSSGNTIASAIEGMSITLAKEGSTTVVVGRDADAVTKNVKDFVDAYNAAIGNIQTALKYEPSTKARGALQGEQTYQTVVNQLRGFTSSTVGSLSGNYTSLASIGITADRSGQLSFDQAAFKKALEADPSAVAKVFTTDSGATEKGTADGVATRMTYLAGQISTDVIGRRLSSYTTQTNRINDRIASLEDTMTIREARLRAKFSAMDTRVAQFSGISSQLAAKLG